MKPGPLEIVLIIFVIIAIAVIARIIGPARKASQENRKSNNASTGSNTEKYAKLLGRTGIALVIAGGITLIAGISMLQWVLHNYVLSFVLIVVGVIIFIMSRRRR